MNETLTEQLIARLEAYGFNRIKAAALLTGLDDLLDPIAERSFSDNTEGAEQRAEASTNGESPATGAGIQSLDFEIPTGAEAGYAEADAQSADEEDDEEEKTLVLDLDEAAEAALFDAASAELNHPHTLQQNQTLLAALPEWLAALVREWMRFVKIPALLPVTCLLVAISAALMRGLRCWSSKGWVYPNLYALLGAESGVGKTLVYNEVMGPLEELDNECQASFDDLVCDLRAELTVIESTIKAKNSAYQRALRESVTLSDAEQQNFKKELAALQKEKHRIEKEIKRQPSLWASDFTAEALGTLLQDNDEQLSIQSDEGGVALFNIEGKYNESGQTDDILLCKCFTGNAHKVHRISRPPVKLKHPRCSMLLLVQPDLLRRAFRNERLIIGGFLARTLSLDCRLQMQPELLGAQEPINAELTVRWKTEFKALYHNFRCAGTPCTVQVDDKTRDRARRHYNAIVKLVRHRLNDVGAFAARWTELTWRVALCLHAVRYNSQSGNHTLEEKTYQAAVWITEIFFLEQLKMLQMLRVDRAHNTHTRLQTLFLASRNAPITLRDLKRRHGLETNDVETCVKMYPSTYGLVTRKSARGSPSTLLFLKDFPPSGV